ncbi:MAG TPA: tRNA (5-methylaminomethyl-2-thiouridine)(34)-methyltransferase MnmD [Bacteroidales bacterium]|nr:tRNA (5-methylaminomethyl-2-thiouridine)(34)-methyltransferase MnmD [Bacteroidales bacterium]
MKVLPVITGDGSHTLLVPELHEHYHSVHGAIAESRHVFVEAGLNRLIPFKSKIRVLEIGFGTGLNALLTFFEARLKNVSVDYTAVEPYPLEPAIWEALNYPELLTFPDARSVYRLLHTSPPDHLTRISPLFFLEKRVDRFQTAALPVASFDVVYLDAFGPEVQPEMWLPAIFEKLFRVMDHDSILVTYSSKGAVRRAMKQAGFTVTKIPGPEGKREMTRAFRKG